MEGDGWNRELGTQIGRKESKKEREKYTVIYGVLWLFHSSFFLFSLSCLESGPLGRVLTVLALTLKASGRNTEEHACTHAHTHAHMDPNRW